MCPIAQGAPSLSALLTKIPFTHVPHCPCPTLLMCQKDVKLSKRCQMSKSQTHGLWRRFTDIFTEHIHLVKDSKVKQLDQ